MPAGHFEYISFLISDLILRPQGDLTLEAPLHPGHHPGWNESFFGCKFALGTFSEVKFICVEAETSHFCDVSYIRIKI